MEKHLYSLLTRGETREIPRRAAVLGDDIVELYMAPQHTKECYILSKICEVLRDSLGYPIYSRTVSVLLHQCLHQGDERAWEALAQDAMCGLLTCEDLTRYFQEKPDDAACFVWRIQDAKSMVHSAYILRVFSDCVDPLSTSSEAAEAFTHALKAGQGTAFLAAYATHAKSLPAKPRASALESFGSLLHIDEVFDALASDVMHSIHTSSSHAEDVLSILMASSCASTRFQHVAGVDAVVKLKKLLLKAPLPRRAPYFHALAYLVEPGDTEMAAIAFQTLKGCGQQQSCHDVFLAVVRLISALEPGSDHVGGILARALLENNML
jgi:hypothetical protein